MKNKILTIFICLFSISQAALQSFSSGHSDVEYNEVSKPGLTVKNEAQSALTSSNMSVFNNENYRLDFGVRSSTFGSGPNHSFIQSWYNRPIDFYTGAKKRVSIDSLGRVLFTGDGLISDTIVSIKSDAIGANSVVGVSSIMVPSGPNGYWGIGGAFQGGHIGVKGVSNNGVAVRANTSSGIGVLSEAVQGNGIQGHSTHGFGIFGYSDNFIGIYGLGSDSSGIKAESYNDHGIIGLSNTANKAGVYGRSSDPAGYGVLGVSITRSAIRGEAQEGTGVFGLSVAGTGVVAQSTDGHGLDAQSNSNHGIIASTQNASKYDFKANGPGMDYGAGSSRRWKSNIENIENPLEMIAKLRGVRYDWDEKHGGGRHDIGFIAEEVGKILPEIVTYEQNGIDAIAMDYTKVPALLVEAINALKKAYDEKIKAQDERIRVLESVLVHTGTEKIH